jgi:uncharacterized protein (TIGR00255 family)
MIRSMTGFGRAERSAGSLRVGVEIRSLNHRHVEVRLKVPAALAALEEGLRKRLGAVVQRGRAEATVSLSGQDLAAPVEVNHSLIKGYLKAAGEVARRHNLAGEVTLETVLSLPGAVSLRTENGDISARERKAVEAAFDSAVKELDRSRVREGKHLAGDLSKRFRAVERHRSAIARRSKGAATRWARRLKERLEQIDGAQAVDPSRLAQEVAFLASRCDITEELVRLRGHLEEALALLRGGREPIGRKLDFLLQELHREANTINSKLEDLEVSRHALAIKAEIEKIREQAQNIE